MQLALDAKLAFRHGFAEGLEQPVGVRDLEIVGRHFDLVLPEHVAVGHPGVVELEVEHIVDALDVHRQPLEPVGQLAGDRPAFEPADLLVEFSWMRWTMIPMAAFLPVAVGLATIPLLPGAGRSRAAWPSGRPCWAIHTPLPSPQPIFFLGLWGLARRIHGLRNKWRVPTSR